MIEINIMNPLQQSDQNETRNYTLMGVLFGFLFPVIATLIKIADAGLPYKISSAVAVQASDPLLWLIDTAPLFLGSFAFIAGQRQVSLQRANRELKQRESELENIKTDLEKNIADHARELIAANRQAVKQTEQLKIIADVARSAIALQDVERLLPHITHLIGQRFNFYHVGIFLLDEQKQYAVLRASNSQGGLEMLKKGYRLRIGTPGIVGYVGQTGQVRIALTPENDPAYFGDADLPHTRSEIALPLKSGEVIFGVMDIQSTETNAFSEDESSTLSILADQTAIAIQSAIAYEQAQRALLEAEVASREGARQAWKGYEKSLERQGYRYDGVRAEPLKEASASAASTLNIPVRLRGLTIGHLKLNHRDASHIWTEDELSLAEATVERVALALEGARLLQDAQQRAVRETFLSDITAKLGASFQMDSILRDTVEELGQTLRRSTVTFQLVDPSDATTTKVHRHNGSSGGETKSE